jgi:hypothetical protein
VNDESKKSFSTMPVHLSGELHPHGHNAFYGFQQANRINHRLVQSYGMRYANPDCRIGIDNLFYPQGARRLIIKQIGESYENCSYH